MSRNPEPAGPVPSGLVRALELRLDEWGGVVLTHGGSRVRTAQGEDTGGPTRSG